MPAPAPTAPTDDAGGDSAGEANSVLQSGAQSSHPEEGENGADTPATAALLTAAGQHTTPQVEAQEGAAAASLATENSVTSDQQPTPFGNPARPPSSTSGATASFEGGEGDDLALAAGAESSGKMRPALHSYTNGARGKELFQPLVLL